MPIKFDTKVNLANYGRFLRALQTDLSPSGKGFIHQSLNNMATINLEFLERRFNIYASGGGNWKPLAASTWRKKGHSLILIDTYTLKNALNPRMKLPGQLKATFASSSGVIGYRVGINRGRHPESKLTVGRLAQYHHEGRGRLPRRTIMAPPDGTTRRRLQKELDTGLRRMVRHYRV